MNSSEQSRRSSILKIMKTKIVSSFLLVTTAICLQGCVAIPPLIQVQHKDGASNEQIIRRLDSIERRLERLEHRPVSGPEHRPDGRPERK
jgi:hypothetical protein